MRTVNILLNSIQNVKNFTNIVSKFESEMDLVYDGYAIDAKSIMGIFSMDLSRPIELHIYTDGEDAEKILGQLKNYVV